MAGFRFLRAEIRFNDSDRLNFEIPGFFVAGETKPAKVSTRNTRSDIDYEISRRELCVE